MYRHFPDEEALFAACSSHWRAANPAPDPQVWAAIEDPTRRTRAALSALYAFYESTEAMYARLFRDEQLMPVVHRRLGDFRRYLRRVEDGLAAGRGLRGRRAELVRAALGHALAFPTWRSDTGTGAPERGRGRADVPHGRRGWVLSQSTSAAKETCRHNVHATDVRQDRKKMARWFSVRPAAVLCAPVVCAALVVTAAHTSTARARSPLPGSFVEVETGPAGGTVWAGTIPDPAVPALRRSSIVYLPPHMTAGVRYPVVYLLQGFRGSPWQYPHGLRLAAVADRGIEAGTLRPFIAVAPPAGLTPAYDGEWAGVWETYLVRDVMPWVDAHLPTIRVGSQRTIVGLSAGGFGAVDIGLRRPGLFGTLESWSGYFTPRRDGPFRDADARTLAEHDPSLLVRTEARALRRLGTRFYLSSGTTTDRRTAARTRAFADELAALRLPHAVYLAPGGHNGRFWRSQFARALRYALSTRAVREQASLAARYRPQPEWAGRSPAIAWRDRAGRRRRSAAA